ncbi:MAG: hypothetical protein PHH99_09580, partial [Pseudomonas fluorescens]|nr:hypothetical protein [Pseudomonas fluorescens]
CLRLSWVKYYYHNNILQATHLTARPSSTDENAWNKAPAATVCDAASRGQLTGSLVRQYVRVRWGDLGVGVKNPNARQTKGPFNN